MNKQKLFTYSLLSVNFILMIALLFFVVIPTAFAASCFTDTEGHWAETYICWMFDNGLSTGFPDGTFRPADNVNRAQMAVLLQQLSGHGTAGAVVNADTINGMNYGSQTGYLSIPAAAFVPSQDGYDYQNYGIGLTHTSGPDNLYFAPLNLPQGATITQVTFYWADMSAGTNGGIMLYRTGYTGTFNMMIATLSTSGSAGYDSSTTTTISYATIDNSQYGYSIGMSLPNSSILGFGVIVEYSYSGLG